MPMFRQVQLITSARLFLTTESQLLFSHKLHEELIQNPKLMDFQSWQLARTHETTAIAKKKWKGSKALVGNSSAPTRSTLLKITHKCDPSTISIYCMAQINNIAGGYALDELDDINLQHNKPCSHFLLSSSQQSATTMQLNSSDPSFLSQPISIYHSIYINLQMHLLPNL
jgi:hypothetical protein